MRVRIVYDNKAMEGMKKAWGFSCLIEHGIRILFDTGGNGDIFLHNLQKMNIDVSEIDAIFISHDHWDHVTGLKAIDFAGPIYVPSSSKIDGIRLDKGEFLPGFISTGTINGEHSLLVKSNGKILIFTGCSHNGVENVIKTAERYGEIYGIIGGFHDFERVEILKNYRMVMPCHCTRLKEKIERFDNAIECMAGKVVEIEL